MKVNFSPEQITVITNDNPITTVLMTLVQTSPASRNTILSGHVGLQWAPMQLSISLYVALGELTQEEIKS